MDVFYLLITLATEDGVVEASSSIPFGSLSDCIDAGKHYASIMMDTLQQADIEDYDLVISCDKPVDGGLEIIVE